MSPPQVLTLKTVLFQELYREVGDDLPPPRTKLEAMARQMVDKAVAGNTNMIAQIVRFVEKVEAEEAAAKESNPAPTPMQFEDWEAMFIFFGKYRALIEQELAARQGENPEYWSFDWYKPTLAEAPWRNTRPTKPPET